MGSSEEEAGVSAAVAVAAVEDDVDGEGAASALEQHDVCTQRGAESAPRVESVLHVANSTPAEAIDQSRSNADVSGAAPIERTQRRRDRSVSFTEPSHQQKSRATRESKLDALVTALQDVVRTEMDVCTGGTAGARQWQRVKDSDLAELREAGHANPYEVGTQQWYMEEKRREALEKTGKPSQKLQSFKDVTRAVRRANKLQRMHRQTSDEPIDDGHGAASDLVTNSRHQMLSSSFQGEDVLTLEVRCSMLSLHMIDTAQQNFRADFHIDLRCRDHAELIEQKLDPEIRAQNAEDVDILMNTAFVRGKDAVWHIRMKGTFQQQYQLHAFPFDTQYLHLVLVSACHKRRTKLILSQATPSLFLLSSFGLSNVWRLIGQEQQLDEKGREHHWLQLVEEEFTTDPAQSASGHTFSGMSVGLFVRRQPMGYIWNVCVPMFLITSMGASITWIDPDQFNDRLSNDFGLLLTAVAFKFVAAQGLPKLSYLTALDEYVLVCYLFIGALVVQHVIVEQQGIQQDGGSLGGGSTVQASLTQRSLDDKLVMGWGMVWLFVNLVYVCHAVRRVGQRPPRYEQWRKTRPHRDWKPHVRTDS